MLGLPVTASPTKKNIHSLRNKRKCFTRLLQAHKLGLLVATSLVVRLQEKQGHVLSTAFVKIKGSSVSNIKSASHGCQA